MRKRQGRPPKTPTGTNTTLTLKIPTQLKQQLITQADAYDMTITEYLTTLIQRDAT
jgi:hypothetical protein